MINKLNVLDYPLYLISCKLSRIKKKKKLNSYATPATPTALKTSSGGFPGGAVVENLPANAGDTGSSPGLGKIPHAAEQLSP